MAGYTTPFHLETDELFTQPFGVLEQERPLPDKPLLLVQVNRETDARLQRRGLGVELVPIEAHACFETKRVPRPEPGGDDAGLDQATPDAQGAVWGKIDLEPVLTRVPGARDDGRNSIYVPFDKPEGFEAGQVHV